MLTWPFRFLDRVAHTELEAWFTPEQISEWRKNGMDDYEADRVAVQMGYLPHEVWPGYLEAGLDAEVYP